MQTARGMLGVILGLAIQTAWACERPAFADTVSKPIAAQDKQVSEAHANFPGRSEDCIYAATWTETYTGLEAVIGVYVATYRAADAHKTAELRYTIAADMLWYNPTVHIDPAVFAVHDTTRAFGIRVAWGFLAGTFGADYERFDLLIPSDATALRSVLSMPISGSNYQRHCPQICKDEVTQADCRPLCEGENTRFASILIIGDKRRQGYRDILVKSTHYTSDPNEEKPEQKRLSRATYRWDGQKYTLQAK